MASFRVFIVVLAAACSSAAVGIETADCERDWSGVQLAWRGDPRAPADAPDGVEHPMTRRQARRARRTAVRGWRSVPLSIAEPAPMQQEARPEQEVDGPSASDIDDGSGIGTIVAERITIRDIPYGEGGHPRQRLNLFLPGEARRADGPQAPYPVVVWIHGENWRDGSKEDCPLSWLTDEGYAVASIGYRLTDTAVFPAQLHDCIAAVRHLQSHAATWNIDPHRLALVGSAAGGHLAALVALDKADSDDAGTPDPVDVAAVCVVAAPTLLTSLGPAHDRPASPASLLVGGPLPEFREAAQRASPLTHVSADAPPFLIIHAKGDERAAADRTVPLEQSRQFDAALRAAGAESSLVVLDGIQPAKVLRDRSAGGGRLLDLLERSFGSSDPRH
jgi:acetyl esterase/lipase